MVIKITKKNKNETTVRYKGVKSILTPKDIKEADQFDSALGKAIKEIERILLKEKMISPYARKSNMLKAWYLIGGKINAFLTQHKVSPEEEGLFWDHLYGRSSLINKTIPTSKISKTRNDFRIASALARYPYKKLKRIKLWAILREIFTYKACRDERVLNWVLQKIEQLSPKTRNEARPFLKAVSLRLKRIDSAVLSDSEILEKLEEVLEKIKLPPIK